MKSGLVRLLRVRALFETLSAQELGRRSAEMRRLDTEAERQQQLACHARARALRLLTAGEDWITGIMDAELARWKSGRLAGLAEARRPLVDAAREELMARRVERRQIESLISEADRAERAERARREQKHLDDWFRSRSSRKRQSR